MLVPTSFLYLAVICFFRSRVSSSRGFPVASLFRSENAPFIFKAFLPRMLFMISRRWHLHVVMTCTSVMSLIGSGCFFRSVVVFSGFC